jgi:hypothetical protein
MQALGILLFGGEFVQRFQVLVAAEYEVHR